MLDQLGIQTLPFSQGDTGIVFAATHDDHEFALALVFVLLHFFQQASERIAEHRLE